MPSRSRISTPYTLTYRVNHLPWLEGMVTWWPLDVDGSDIFGGLNGLLLGDVAFSTGATACSSTTLPARVESDVAGRLCPTPAPGPARHPSRPMRAPRLQLRHHRHQHRLAAVQYPQPAAAARLEFGHRRSRPGLPLRSALQHAAIRAWHQRRRVHRDLDSRCGQPQPLRRRFCFRRRDDGTLQCCLRAAALTAPTTPCRSTTRPIPGIAWCCPRPRTRACAPPAQRHRDGTAGVSFVHGAAAFSSGFRIGLSQFMGTSACVIAGGCGSGLCHADQRPVRRGQPGLLRRRHRHAHGRARVAPHSILAAAAASASKAGLTRSTSLTPRPLVEWYNPSPPTNQTPLGVQFWLALTNGPGSLGAVIWDTNSQPHVITTAPLALTNGGWQHVALTYDTTAPTRSFTPTASRRHRAVPGHFVPRTSGDLYLGLRPGHRTAAHQLPQLQFDRRA